MLEPAIIKKIEEFVYPKPRTVQEIAQHLGKNWRTADRYVEEIQKEFGTVSTRKFREGTRGALKIVYWSSIEKVSYSIFQEKLEQEIMSLKQKRDFSAFDIFQHIPDKNKHAIVEPGIDDSTENLKELKDLLEKAEKQVLIFSGDLSFTNYKNFEIKKILEELAKRGVKIKIICRVDIAALGNIERILSLNFKGGKEMIEIRHREQPLRAFVIDNKIIRIKEVKEPTGKIKELDKRIFIFYTLKDKEWAEWLSKIFFKMFSQSIDARKRLEEVNKLKVKK
ncbi:Uncharacterised protein [uncultured archaeon]|nr:Uncharacterised protein [uncultured archaeon]